MKKTIAILAALSLVAATAPSAGASDDSEVNDENHAVVVSGGCTDAGTPYPASVTDGGEDDAGVGVSVQGGPSVTVDPPSGGGGEALVQFVEGVLFEGQPPSASGTNFCDGSTGYIEWYWKVSGVATVHVCFDGDASLLEDCHNGANDGPVGPITVP